MVTPVGWLQRHRQVSVFKIPSNLLDNYGYAFRFLLDKTVLQHIKINIKSKKYVCEEPTHFH